MAPTNDRHADAAVARSSGRLAGARLLAQGAAFAWFVVAVRSLTREEMGRLAAGLAIMAVTSALAELGVNRTVTRHLATRRRVRPTLRRAARVRLAGGLVVGPAIGIAAAAIGIDVPVPVIALSIVVSVVSGLTDLGLAALRATRSVGVEVTLLVVERLAFLLAAWVCVRGGGGAVGIMVVYLVTNALSAAVAWSVIAIENRPEYGPGPPMLDAEGRRTAAQSAVSLLLIRIAPLSIAVVGSAAVIGGMSVVHRPVEAAMWVGATALSVVHPEARRRVASGAIAEERRLVMRAAAVVGVTGAVGVAVLWPTRELVLRVLAGSDVYSDVGVALVAFAAVSTVSLLRQAAEVSALAEERAVDAVRAGLVGLGVGVGSALWWVPAFGLRGAIGAQGAAEVVALLVLVLRARRRTRTAAPGEPGSIARQGDPSNAELVGAS